MNLLSLKRRRVPSHIWIPSHPLIEPRPPAYRGSCLFSCSCKGDRADTSRGAPQPPPLRHRLASPSNPICVMGWVTAHLATKRLVKIPQSTNPGWNRRRKRLEKRMRLFLKHAPTQIKRKTFVAKNTLQPKKQTAIWHSFCLWGTLSLFMMLGSDRWNPIKKKPLCRESLRQKRWSHCSQLFIYKLFLGQRLLSVTSNEWNFPSTLLTFHALDAFYPGDVFKV